MKLEHSNRIIISGGGTGGHIFPAISIANSIKNADKSAEILFVGAKGKMEMEKVPIAGYKIVGLPVRGFQRKFTLKNFSVIYRLFISMIKAKKILKNFKPDIVVGVGGFASGPVLRAAVKKNIPTLIQEQNSYAGITNRILAKSVDRICVAYDDMERFFPEYKIIKTGNPVRQKLLNSSIKKEDGLLFFELEANKRTLLVLGGSLGALTINESIANNLDKIIEAKVQLIWQTGKAYYPKAKELVEKLNNPAIKVKDFISRMELAYTVADVVISRAGASTVSELTLIKKPAILIPSPNVAEDHQTKNAMALIKNDAAMMITDKEARKLLVDEAIKLIKDDFRLEVYRNNIAKMGVKNSADIIRDEIFKLIEASKLDDLEF